MPPETPSSSSLPTPPAGVGAADLATDSQDPQELRALLDRARERLAFYESFDRIIGENIRRSGELMVETVALREQAQTLAVEAQREREAFAATRQEDQERYRALIANALAEVEGARPVIDGAIARLQGVLAALDSQPVEAPAREDDSDDAHDPDAVPTTAALVEPWHTDSDATDTATAASSPAETAEPVPSDADDETLQEDEAASAHADAETGPREISLLAHGVPSAKVAIQLQNMLRGLAPVTKVDTREFANGELRLTITATDALPEGEMSAWLGENGGTLTGTSPSVVEVTFS